jgi:serine/threonine protein kinase
MKSGHEVESVEELCRLLLHSRLLSPEEVEDLLRRWRAEPRQPAGVTAFSHWLVEERVVTEHQAGRLLRGRDSNFFLAGYKLLDQLSRGRHTVVYKGVDRVGRLAALKVLPASQATDPRTLARFLREARRGRELSHANVVHVVESGEDRGAHYLVMDHLEGETLQKALRSRRRLPPDEAIDLGLQVLEGLAYLHGRGLVHRNLTPANLMLVRRVGVAGPPLVKILDLGLTRAAGEEDLLEIGMPSKAHDEALRGAAAYLAPELVRDPTSADIRADLYGLGCVLYHALAGQTPFPDPSPEVQVLRHATESPRPLRELNPELPEELARVVARLAARDPAKRFANPAEAAEALRGASEKEGVATVDVEPVDLPPAWLADHAPTAVSDASQKRSSWVAPVPPPLPPPLESPLVETKEESLFPPGFDLGQAPAQDPLVASVPTRRPRQRAARGVRMDRRDWLMLLAGAGVMLAVQALAWLAARLIAARASEED